jgi:hypothetical protein
MNAVNEMSELLLLSTHLNRKTRQGELVQSAKIGCTTLIRLSNDRAFYNDIQLLASRKQENASAFMSITGDVNHFLNHFLEIEERILSESGASPIVIKVLKIEAERVQASVKNAQFDIQTVKTHTGRLQEISCNIAKTLLIRQAQESEKETHKQNLKAVALAIGGATLIGLNASTNLLSPAGSATSGALGLDIMKSNLSKILDKKT